LCLPYKLCLLCCDEGIAGSMAKRILIMDDDPTIADLLTEALADEGYETFMTTQSLRFYDAVHEHKPDLVLLDLMMPYLDGRDELKLMAMGVDHKIPVIVVTAFLGAINEEKEFRDAGVAHIVYKPFDLDKLVALVRGTIGEPEGKSA
jgi:DNA-binding response OmpR family regulator